MKNDELDKLEKIYGAPLALDSGPRPEFVPSDCGDDEELRAEIESLLALEEGLGSFMEKPAMEAVTITSIDESLVGHILGRYELLQKIGEGGMGEVWLAEQKEPVRRRVALKLVKAGMNTPEVLSRFESERQALALMDHPAIAKVFDAGSTTKGTPYFVMEYVAGVPIVAYCDNHRFSTHERLELFMRVCEGVQHAHQKAIIHRDLKPSNILVTEVDGRAAPKIIDFGVAKAIAQKLTADTMFTRVGALVGTPEYMSPEQANSSGEDIDTRSDVYSLGVIFYELLAGVPPLELRKIAFEEFLRRLREDEPLKPSTKVRSQAQTTSTEVARKRQTEPRALAKQIRGDLDSIALKALEKERSRRYGSPSDLAADIGRYLKNEAVLAVPLSAAYRARKFARRQRPALVTVGAFALVLLVSAVVSIRQGLRADREAAVAQVVNDFLQNDLLAQASASNQSGPRHKPDPDLKVRTALDRAAERITGKFDRQPEVEAAIRQTIGETYMDLGLYPEARMQLERARDLQRRVLGAQNPRTLKTVSRLGRLAREQGNRPEAETLLSQTLEIQRRELGSEHPDTLDSMSDLVDVYRVQGKYGQAVALDNQILEIRRRVLGPEHRNTLSSLNNLAKDYYWQGNYTKAEELDSQALDLRRRVLGPEHPDTLQSVTNLAIDYADQGKYAQAEALDSQALEISRRVLPELSTVDLINNLARDLYFQGRYAQEEALQSQALEIQRRALGPEHPTTLYLMNNLAIAYRAQGKYAQAEALSTQALDIQRRVLGPEHPRMLLSMDNLANIYAAQGKYTQAEALYLRVLELSRTHRSDDPWTLYFLSDFAFMYQLQGKYTLAEKYAAQALAGRRLTLGSENQNTMSAASYLALAYLSQGRFSESEPLAREAVEFYRKKRLDNWQWFCAESQLGASLAGQKKYAEAEPLLLEGYQGMVARKDRIEAWNWYHLDRARGWIVRLYQSWGKRAKAAEWSKKI